ncbi:hypothetical protein BHM03_00059268 [Ensete ventricosum]|uniref:Uncharacterized protein n=1 Tax=Ensete ventricosum TaxID=4639 RepID=A0A427A690_ENSVE|nr:hypothetical protein B296_00022073 [Ensete ventricosum]RZS25986.1 hypothetical protein BHM03_00059268 [Ensete ventricosum]
MELDERASRGETVVPGGTGGKSLEAQEHLAEGTVLMFYTMTLRDMGRVAYKRWLHAGRSRGGQTRREQLGTEGYQDLGHKGGQTRREQLGTEGYQEMGRKGGLSTTEESGGERAQREGIEIDESKFRTQ